MEMFGLGLALDGGNEADRARLAEIIRVTRAQLEDARSGLASEEISGRKVLRPGDMDMVSGSVLWDGFAQAVRLDLSIEEVWTIQKRPADAEAMAVACALHMERLPERQREAVRLYFWRQDGVRLSQREAAAHMCIKQPPFLKLVRKGLANLRKILLDAYVPAGVGDINPPLK